MTWCPQNNYPPPPSPLTWEGIIRSRNSVMTLEQVRLVPSPKSRACMVDVPLQFSIERKREREKIKRQVGEWKRGVAFPGAIGTCVVARTLRGLLGHAPRVPIFGHSSRVNVAGLPSADTQVRRTEGRPTLSLTSCFVLLRSTSGGLGTVCALTGKRGVLPSTKKNRDTAPNFKGRQFINRSSGRNKRRQMPPSSQS